MKKVIFTTLTLALTFGVFQGSSWAARDSASLAVNNNLQSDISEAENVGSPIGSVMAWPFAKNPKDGIWLDCNGQILNSKDYPEFVALFGNKLPDYRGQFLRGMQTGKSLGQRVAHSLASHKHVLPEHEHDFEGQTNGDGTSATNVIQSLSSSPKYKYTATSSVFTQTQYKWGEAVKKREGVNFDMRKVVGIDFNPQNAPMNPSWKEKQLFEEDGSFSSRSSGTVSAKVTNPYILDRMKELGLYKRTLPRGDMDGSNWNNNAPLHGYLLTPANSSTSSASSSVHIEAITNQKVSGKVHSKAMDTENSGDLETAPNHTYIRYIIRVK